MILGDRGKTCSQSNDRISGNFGHKKKKVSMANISEWTLPIFLDYKGEGGKMKIKASTSRYTSILFYILLEQMYTNI